MPFVRNNRKNKHAFTLVEIIVVLIIIGVLVAMAIPNYMIGVNRTYARDAMHNLLSIGAGQLTYKQNNPNYNYCTTACGDYASINNLLHLTITPELGMAYYCDQEVQSGSVHPVCHANWTRSRIFDMILVLDSPENGGTVPVYCGNGNNPCCQGGTAGNICPS